MSTHWIKERADVWVESARNYYLANFSQEAVGEHLDAMLVDLVAGVHGD